MGPKILPCGNPDWMVYNLVYSSWCLTWHVLSVRYDFSSVYSRYGKARLSLESKPVCRNLPNA